MLFLNKYILYHIYILNTIPKSLQKCNSLGIVSFLHYIYNNTYRLSYMGVSPMISTFLVEERIRQLRKQHNLSQDELAQLAGISSNYMGQIERGEKCPTLDVFLQISLALNVSPVELINDCDSMPATIYTPELNKVIQLLRTYSCSELNEVYKVLSSISKIKQPM